jgi:dolichol-phosphate mannosyltransferase
MVRGELIFVLDGDLQDPPELLPDMMRLLDAGADVVYGQRSKRAGESLFKKQSATIFYRVVNWLSEINIPVDAGDFRLMRRSVVNVLLDMPESHRFIRGMVAWVGFKQVPLVYEREARFAGHSKYPLRKMVLFAVDAISGFSIVPLRLAFYLAALFMIAALLLGAYVIGVWLFVGAVRGWTSLLLLFLMFSGVQLLCISIIGEYVGRTYMQTKGRPLFIIKEVYTQPEAKPADHEARVKRASLENA